MNKISGIVVAVGLLFAGSATAAVHTYEFGGAVINGTGITPATSFATLTINDVTNQFTLTLGDLVALGFGSDANATDLAVSYPGTPGSIPGISGVVGGVTAITTSNANQPGGAFDFGFGFNSGSNELTSNESVSWIATGFDFSQLTSTTLGGYTGNFALRVQGAGQGSSGNGWYGAALAAVPEPETYAMMLAGLALVGFAGRRKA